MAAIGQFNANEHEASQPIEVMPDHWATAYISDSELKPTNAGDGHYVSMEFTICDGQQFAKRKLWMLLNLDNPNEKAVAIAQSDLAAMCLAVNKPRINDTCEIHNMPMDIKVGTQKATFRKDPQTKKDMLGADGKPIIEYEAKNQIKGFAPAGAKASAMGAAGGSAGGQAVAQVGEAAQVAQVAQAQTQVAQVQQVAQAQPQTAVAQVQTAAVAQTTEVQGEMAVETAQVQTAQVETTQAAAATGSQPAWATPAS